MKFVESIESHVQGPTDIKISSNNNLLIVLEQSSIKFLNANDHSIIIHSCEFYGLGCSMAIQKVLDDDSDALFVIVGEANILKFKVKDLLSLNQIDSLDAVLFNIDCPGAYGLAIRQDKLYVSNKLDNTIYIYDASTGDKVKNESVDHPFDSPPYLIALSNNNLTTADRMIVTEMEGNVCTVLEKSVVNGGQEQWKKTLTLNVIDGPHGIAINPENGHIFVSSLMNSELVELDENLKSILNMKHGGSMGFGLLWNDRKLFICDTCKVNIYERH